MISGAYFHLDCFAMGLQAAAAVPTALSLKLFRKAVQHVQSRLMQAQGPFQMFKVVDGHCTGCLQRYICIALPDGS